MMFLEVLPHVVLGQLGHYLGADGLRAVRQLSEYFDQFFDNEAYYRRLLHYPVKYFVCDRMSQSTVQNIQLILQESNENNFWRINYRLQEAHLQNWNAGRINNSDAIQVSPATVSEMIDIVDDDSNHLLFISVNTTVCVWDIRDHPEPLQRAVSVGFHTGLEPLSSGKLLVLNRRDDLVTIFRFHHPTIEFQYKFVYNMHRILDRTAEPPMRVRSDFSYIVMRDSTKDLFIGYECVIADNKYCCLHIWDLDNRVKLETVNLFEFDVMQAFIEFVRQKINRVNLTSCSVSLYPGDFPNVIVIFNYKFDNFLSQVNIFNLETMKLTHLVKQLLSDVISCSVYEDKIFLEESIRKKGTRVFFPSVYGLQNEPQERVPLAAGGDAVIPVWGKGLMPELVEIPNEPNYNILLTNSKVLVKTENAVKVFCFQGMIPRCSEFPVTASYGILGFIKPEILLMRNTHQNPTDTNVEVYSLRTGATLISWENINLSDDRFLRYFRNLKYPSKVILGVTSEQRFAVFNF